MVSLSYRKVQLTVFEILVYLAATCSLLEVVVVPFRLVKSNSHDSWFPGACLQDLSRLIWRAALLPRPSQLFSKFN